MLKMLNVRNVKMKNIFQLFSSLSPDIFTYSIFGEVHRFPSILAEVHRITLKKKATDETLTVEIRRQKVTIARRA